ncbi:MAG TPA: hypothetical protein VJ346_03470 [Bacteroidales bacterium]|nr:hypothetical protein [Bacteroidales bacterium]
MSKVFIIFIFLIIAVTEEVTAQNYVGVHKDEIIRLMSEKHRNFKLNKDVINRRFTYLKYEDDITEQTILFFLSDKGYCTLVRWMSDYSNINDILSVLNKEYKQAGKNQWTYTKNGKNYVINLEKGEWFFTVSYKLKCN